MRTFTCSIVCPPNTTFTSLPVAVRDQSEDFILSSHVVEHLPNVIAAFIEWNRIVRDSGYVFMIVPLRDAFEGVNAVAREASDLAGRGGDNGVFIRGDDERSASERSGR